RPLPYDPRVKIDEFEAIKLDVEHSIGAEDSFASILHRNCCEYQQVVRMLESRGTPQFYEFSRQLYGSPKDRFAGDTTTVRELGLLLYDILSGIPEDGLGVVHPRLLAADEVVSRLNECFGRYFSDNAVHARLDDGILSDAAAGADYVKIKRGIMFSER